MVTLRKGKKVISIPLGVKQELSKMVKPPMMVQSISFADEVEDDEEDSFLDANPTIVPVFEVDVERILEKYVACPDVHCAAVRSSIQETAMGKSDKPEESDKVEVTEKEDVPPKEAITREEFLYDKLMEKVSRVKEDDLQDLNLGTAENPKCVKVSVHLEVHLEDDFKQNLKVLL